MKILKIIICSAAIILFGCSSAQVRSGPTDADSAKYDDIRELMEVLGGKQMFEQLFVQTMNQFTAYLINKDPDIKEMEEDVILAVTDVTKAVFSENMDYFIVGIMKIYDKHYTHDEIKELISFYNSKAGKKTVKIMPQIMAESYQLGMEFQEHITPILIERITERFKEEGYDLKL